MADGETWGRPMSSSVRLSADMMMMMAKEKMMIVDCGMQVGNG